LQRRKMKATPQMVVFHQPAMKRGYGPVVLPRK
jgi:hypothetical protein